MGESEIGKFEGVEGSSVDRGTTAGFEVPSQSDFEGSDATKTQGLPVAGTPEAVVAVPVPATEAKVSETLSVPIIGDPTTGHFWNEALEHKKAGGEPPL